MAEGFEPYHVPQQSRRDKLRVISAASHLLSPPYDHHHHHPLLISSSPSDLPLLGSSSSSSNTFRNPYGTANLDPQFHDHSLLAHTFPYGGPSPNTVDHGGGGDEVVVFKPEPLTLSLASSYDFSPAAIFDGVSRNVPVGPFTGYASVLKGSRFLKPAQQLLEEFCYEVVGANVVGNNASENKINPDSSLMVMETNAIVDDDDDEDDGDGDDRDDDDRISGNEIRKKKSRLISMLDEVYRRYKQYYQQMQAVITSFEYIAGLGNAAPYANLAVKSITRHFRCLKNAIMDQLQFAGKDDNAANNPVLQRKDEPPIFRSRGIYGQRPIHGSVFLEHQPVWRPQRGLPERAVTVLRAWLFEHFLHPYPTDTDKLMLAKQTGLSRSQVSNWFINARVRLWKPMVEEIHTLEMRQAQKSLPRSDQEQHHRNPAHIPSSMSAILASEKPSTSTHRAPDQCPATSSKRTRNEVPVGSHEDANASTNSYANLASQLQVGNAGMGVTNGANNGVSLTLGLHQNSNGIVFSEAFPINAAQRFGIGLEGGGDGFAMSAFEVQNRHFGRDVIGGQLLHDFVG